MTNRVILPTVTASLGGLWVVVGLSKYSWYLDGKPGSGFFPVIAGALLIFVSILAIISESKQAPPDFFVYHFHPILAAIGMIATALLIGFFPALTIYVFGWLRFYEKYSMKLSLATTFFTSAGMYGIFAMWLRVPFPVGMIFERLVG